MIMKQFSQRALFALCLLAAWLGAPVFSQPSVPAPVVASASRATTGFYRNPVALDVADPFVLKFRGEYYLYRTGYDTLDVLLSRDLVNWRQGPIVWKPDTPAAKGARLAWAPEVIHENGVFRLYFNADVGTGQQLWMAESDSPLGPFKTHPGGPMTAPWRIDISPLVDDDGARYLFSCIKPPDGDARIEARRVAAPWERIESGWQTMLAPQPGWEGGWIEAPTLLKDASGYYMIYSGGGAHLPAYQSGYATAQHPLGPWTRRGLLIPNTPAVPGPGHQSVVLAPDNLTPYLIYHRKRVAEEGWPRELMIDRLQMGGGRLRTHAPTTTPQPAPPRPVFQDWFDGPASLRSWTTTGGIWRVNGAARELVQSDAASATARARLNTTLNGDGVIEVNLRRVSGEGELGVVLTTSGSRLPIVPFAGQSSSIERQGVSSEMASGLNPNAYHQLLLTRRGATVEIRVDGRLRGVVPFPVGPASLELVAPNCAAAFDGISVTNGTAPRPLGPPEAEAVRQEWHRDGSRIEQRGLGPGLQIFALPQNALQNGAMNIRLQGWALGITSGFPKYGVRVGGANGDYIEAFIDPKTGVLATHGSQGGREVAWQNSTLPLGFTYTDWHELQLSRRGDVWSFAVDGASVQSRTVVLRGPLRPSLVTEDARAAFVLR